MANLRVRFPKPCPEKWEAMAPLGNHRSCAMCDKIVHDLAEYDIDEAEALLGSKPDICVRARIDSHGVVMTKPDRTGSFRQIVTAVGVSAGLLVSAPTIAREKASKGAIAGQERGLDFGTQVIARDSEGRAFRTTVKTSGSYRIKNLVPGTYTVEFISLCGERWMNSNVVVGEGQTISSEPPGDYSGCVIVGRLESEDQRG